MRGRLIFPFIAEIAQLDTRRMATTDPDGATGPLTGGYDDVFDEPVTVPDSSTDTTGTVYRLENCIQLPAQIEPRSFNELRQLFSGASPNAQIELIFHFRDLERCNLVDPTTGEALIRNNDRLNRILDIRGNLVQAIRNPPGLFAVQTQPRGFGLGCGNRNLLLVTFEERERGPLLRTT